MIDYRNILIQFRFLLPVPIPSFLCLITIWGFEFFEKTYIKYQLLRHFLYLYIDYYRGLIYFENYSIGFEYACSFPMAMLYSHNNKFTQINLQIKL